MAKDEINYANPSTRVAGFQPPSKVKPDAYNKMFKGVVALDETVDGFWIEVGQKTVRDEVMRQVDAIENGFSVSTGVPDYVTVGKDRIAYTDLREWQAREAYRMLKDEKADPRDVAARVHRSTEWVRNLQKKFNL